jgi:hypothetical protein
MSAGKKVDCDSERFMMSPGTRTVESRSTPKYVVIQFVGEVWVDLDLQALSTNTLTLHTKRDISRILAMVYEIINK